MNRENTERQFESFDIKPMRKSTRIIAVAAGILLVVTAVFTRRIYTGLIGLVLIAVTLFKKRIFVTEAGVETEYDMVIFNHVELWPFDEIKEIDKELSPDGTRMGLHFLKEVMGKRLIFSLDEYEDVIALAKEKNPDIVIGVYNK